MIDTTYQTRRNCVMTKQDWELELLYIEMKSVGGKDDPRTLTNFNQDKDCFNRYIDMQANGAEREGFAEIAEGMRKQKL